MFAFVSSALFSTNVSYASTWYISFPIFRSPGEKCVRNFKRLTSLRGVSFVTSVLCLYNFSNFRFGSILLESFERRDKWIFKKLPVRRNSTAAFTLMRNPLIPRSTLFHRHVQTRYQRINETFFPKYNSLANEATMESEVKVIPGNTIKNALFREIWNFTEHKACSTCVNCLILFRSFSIHYVTSGCCL